MSNRTVIQNEAVMSGTDRVVYAAFSSCLIALLLLISFTWLSLAYSQGYVLVGSLVYLFVMNLLAKLVYRWYVAYSMKRPRHLSAPAGASIAMAVTFVPDAEPIEMLRRTLGGIMRVEYPHDVFVLDEGNDPRVLELCEQLGARHFSRKGRPEYNQPFGPYEARTKAGNINAWLTEHGYGYEIVTLLDSDQVPERHFLRRVLGYFRDEDVGFVQGPQVYCNKEESFVARGAAELTYHYYGPHYMGLYGMGLTIVDGCHTTFRTRVIRALGGYPVHAVEDLLLTHELRERNVKGIYVPEVLARGLAPADWRAYFQQQARWAFGTLDLKFWYFPRVRKLLSPIHRLCLFSHGLIYLSNIKVPAGIALSVGLLIFGQVPEVTTEFVIQCLILCGLGLGMGLWLQKFNIVPREERGVFWRAAFLGVARWPVYVTAVIRALRRKEAPRRVTPKIRDDHGQVSLFVAHIAAVVILLLALAISFDRDGASLGIARVWAAVSLVSELLLVVGVLRWSKLWLRLREIAISDVPRGWSLEGGRVTPARRRRAGRHASVEPSL